MIAYFAITFALLFAVALIGFLIYASPGIKKKTDIPGPLPSDEKQGNIADIAAAGSLHEFVCDLHERYGSVVGFYFGKQFVVSLASPSLFRQTERLFDRPTHMYLPFKPLIGSASIQYANGDEGKRRRTEYDRAMSHSSVEAAVPTLLQCVNELVTRLAGMAKQGQHVPLMQYCIALATKAIIRVTLEPDGTRLTDKQVSDALKWYNIAWAEMESRLAGTSDAGDDQDGRQSVFDDAVKRLKQFVDGVVHKRRHELEMGSGRKEPLLLDRILQLNRSDDETAQSDAITYMVGGFHTSGTLLAWALYYVCIRPDLAERIREEAVAAVEADGGLSAASLSRLNFTRRFIDEVLRFSCMAPMAMRVSEDADLELDGFIVPAGTPLLLALGTSFVCEDNFDKPEVFNPDRKFDDYQPFGWGRRRCPGYRLAYAEVSLWLAVLLTKFRFNLADEECQAVPAFGLVTKPRDEIWATVCEL